MKIEIKTTLPNGRIKSLHFEGTVGDARDAAAKRQHPGIKVIIKVNGKTLK